MEENYINIYSSFLAELIERREVTPEQLAGLLTAFYPVCEQVRSRQDLVDFLDSHISTYPQLERLRQQLLDPEHAFAAPGLPLIS